MNQTTTRKTNMNNSPSNVVALPVIEQVRKAFLRTNRLATFCGFLLGSFVPVASYVIGHYEAPRTPAAWNADPLSAAMWLLVAGGLLYSAITVFSWSKVAFKNPAKAVGFCVLIEGVMTFSHTYALALTALGLLIAINGIATGCTLALDQKTARVRR